MGFSVDKVNQNGVRVVGIAKSLKEVVRAIGHSSMPCIVTRADPSI